MSSIGVRVDSLELVIFRALIAALSPNYIENTDQAIIGGVETWYDAPNGSFNTVFDEGGFVYDFDDKLILKNHDLD